MGNENQSASKPDENGVEDDSIPMNTSLTEYIYKDCDNYPDKKALHEYTTGRTITFRELKRKVCAVASALAKRHFGKEQFLTLFGDNHIENIPVAHGAIATGGTVDLIKPGASKDEFLHHMCLVQPRFLVITADCQSMVSSIINEFDFELENIFVIGEISQIGEKFHSVEELLQDPGDANPMGSVVIDTENDVAVMLQTGGTTGASKIVMATHKAIILTLSKSDKFPEKDKQLILTFLPFNYVSGFIFTYSQWIRHCSTIVFLPHFEPTTVLQAIEEHNIFWMVLSPATVAALTQSPNFKTCDISSLKFVVWMGAPISKELEMKMTRIFDAQSPGISFFQGYGATEVLSGIAAMGETMWITNKQGSVGRPIKGIEVKIIDSDGKICGPDEPGEILIKTETMMKGYFKNEELTRQVLKDGWYYSGDYGWQDADNFIYVVDRIGDLIRTKNGLVLPSRLESIIQQHENVVECIVIGKDSENGKVPFAYVVSNDNITPNEIQSFVSKNVDPLYHLSGVRIVHEIPKSPAGKLLRKNML